MRALLIPVDGEPREVEQTGLDDLQKLVGGDIQMLDHPERSDLRVVIDEEGKLKERPLNESATRLMRPILRRDDYIVGDAVLIGFDPASGGDLPLPEDVRLPKPPSMELLFTEPRIERRGRQIVHDWLLKAEEDGKRHYVVLNVRYQQGGRNMFSGALEPRCYQATLGRETEEDASYGGTMRGFRIFSAMLLCRSGPVGRYSAKKLDEFASVALARLREVAEGNEKVTRYLEERAD